MSEAEERVLKAKQELEEAQYALLRERVSGRRCSVCGRPDEDTDELEWPGFIDVRVITADGEEGFADITQLLCAEHFTEVQAALLALGFRDHRHGSTNFLEDMDCPGWGKCPTPTEYGEVTVSPDWPKPKVTS